MTRPTIVPSRLQLAKKTPTICPGRIKDLASTLVRDHLEVRISIHPSGRSRRCRHILPPKGALAIISKSQPETACGITTTSGRRWCGAS